MKYIGLLCIFFGLVVFSGCGLVRTDPMVAVNLHLNDIQSSENIAGQLSYIANPVDVDLEVGINSNYSASHKQLSHDDIIASDGWPLIIKPLPEYHDRRLLSVGPEASTVEWFSIPTFIDSSEDMWICGGVYNSKWRWLSGDWRMIGVGITLNCTWVNM